MSDQFAIGDIVEYIGPNQNLFPERFGRVAAIFSDAIRIVGPVSVRPGTSLLVSPDNLRHATSGSARVGTTVSVPMPDQAVTRFFYVWCMRCPTRVAITTEAEEPDVGGAAMPPSLDACPMCGSDEIASDDELAARDLWPAVIGSEAWREEQARLTASNAAAHAAILKARK